MSLEFAGNWRRPPGPGSLRHNDPGIDIDRILDVLDISALTNHDRTRAMDSIDAGSRVGEGQHHCCRTMYHGGRQQRWGLAQDLVMRPTPRCWSPAASN